MKWINDLKTVTKLSLGFGIVVALFVFAMVTAYQAIEMVGRSAGIAQALAVINGNVNEQRLSMLGMVESDDHARQEMLQERIKGTQTENNDLVQRLRTAAVTETWLLGPLEEYLAVRAEFGNVRDTQLIPLILAGKKTEARELIDGPQNDRYRKQRDLTDQLTKEAQTRAARQLQRGIFLCVGAGVAAVVFAIGVVVLLTRNIGRPLGEISAIAQRIAEGDLSLNLAISDRADEVGALQTTFGRMMENLKRLTIDLTEGINVLASSTTEISTSTSQFSASATETATAVGETTATVEEVRQTAQVSSQKAKAVSETAQKVAQVSQAGRKATEESAEGMGRIREQMEAIAESMVRLSEQSQAIGQIVTTVEDLAAQSNLLAVNAAIEAAKAGEHGKGFAIVAQEVKSLAEQSKQATGQVRTILNDIQKATSAAVLATEQGSKAVEAGVKQSSQAGQSIQALAGGVAEAAQAATQIAASSQQQLVGVDQVATAMESIKQVSQQNVESARQLEIAARNLKALGEKLKVLVERYKV